MVEFAARRQWGATALHWAADGGHAGAARVLLERGASAEARDKVLSQRRARRVQRGVRFRATAVVLGALRPDSRADAAHASKGSGTAHPSLGHYPFDSSPWRR